MLRRSLVFVACCAVLVGQDSPAGDGAPDFVKEVAPILQNRCVSCHGPDKQKGDLRLDRREYVFAAGEEEYWSVLPGKPDESLLIHRVELPVGDEEIMPNEGDPLRPDQVAILRRWIASGAQWPQEGDAWFAKIAEEQRVERIDFGIPVPDAIQQQAIDQAIAALRERGASASVIAEDTPGVDVNVALLGKDFTDRDLDLLQDLRSVLVWLNLSRTAVTDAGLSKLSGMDQLRRLNLSRTAIGDVGVAACRDLQHLEVLNVYGTKVTDAALKGLAGSKSLRKVYAFQTAVTAAGVAAVGDRQSLLVVDRGEYVADRMAKAAAEIAEREAANRPLNSECPVSGKPVDPAVHVEHEGLRIAFCCANCKQGFEQDPQKYKAKIEVIRAAGGKATAGGKDED